MGYTSLGVFPERYHEVSGLVKVLMLSQTQTMGMGKTVSGGFWLEKVSHLECVLERHALPYLFLSLFLLPGC